MPKIAVTKIQYIFKIFKGKKNNIGIKYTEQFKIINS